MIRPFNADRAAKRREIDFGALAEWIRHLPCLHCRTPGPSRAAHVHSRGSGAHAWIDLPDGGGISGNIVPLCDPCHVLQHHRGWSAIGSLLHAEAAARRLGERYLSGEVVDPWEALPW